MTRRIRDNRLDPIEREVQQRESLKKEAMKKIGFDIPAKEINTKEDFLAVVRGEGKKAVAFLGSLKKFAIPRDEYMEKVRKKREQQEKKKEKEKAEVIDYEGRKVIHSPKVRTKQKDKKTRPSTREDLKEAVEKAILNPDLNKDQRVRLALGNHKIDKAFAVWSLPCQSTCPASTQFCREHCYAKKAEAVYPGVLETRIDSYVFSKSKNFVPEMVERIKELSEKSKLIRVVTYPKDGEPEIEEKDKSKGQKPIYDEGYSVWQHTKKKDVVKEYATTGIEVIRIHESGDMYDQEYLDKWFEIARTLPSITFTTYTKAYMLDWSKKPKNFTVNQSTEAPTLEEVQYKQEVGEGEEKKMVNVPGGRTQELYHGSEKKKMQEYLTGDWGDGLAIICPSGATIAQVLETLGLYDPGTGEGKVKPEEVYLCPGKCGNPTKSGYEKGCCYCYLSKEDRNAWYPGHPGGHVYFKEH